MADAQLSLDVRVIELADEGVSPGLARVDGDVHVVLPVPLSPLLQRAAQMQLTGGDCGLEPSLRRSQRGNRLTITSIQQYAVVTAAFGETFPYRMFLRSCCAGNRACTRLHPTLPGNVHARMRKHTMPL